MQQQVFGAKYQDRRHNQRLSIEIWMEEIRGQDIYLRRSENISLGGVYFEQAIPYPVNTPVLLRFSLPPSKQEVIVQGVVVNTAIERTQTSSGMAIEFKEFKDNGKEVLQQFLACVCSKES